MTGQTNNLVERLRNASSLALKKYVTNSSDLFDLAADEIQSLSAHIAVLEGALEPFANLADANMNDPLSKWLTTAHIQNAASITKEGTTNVK